MNKKSKTKSTFNVKRKTDFFTQKLWESRDLLSRIQAESNKLFCKFAFLPLRKCHFNKKGTKMFFITKFGKE